MIQVARLGQADVDAAAGILFGVCNVAVKALSGMVGDHGILGLASPALLVAAIA